MKVNYAHCVFNLGMNYDDLPGVGKSSKAREIVDYFVRRNQLPKLVFSIQQDRPDIDLVVSDLQNTSKPLESMISQFKWSIASIVAVVVGVAITALWMIREPGFEPLLGIIAGVAAAGSIEKIKLPLKFDILLATTIAIISIFGVTYLLNPTTKNHPPVIHSLIVSREIISPGETSVFKVEATDEDGDPLSYIWSAKRGKVPSGNQGPTIDYIAPINPETGIDTIRVTVFDDKGGNTVEEANIAIESQN